MAETKKERIKWVDAVTRMIELTQQGKMRWDSVVPLGSAAEEKNRTSAVFRITHNGKTLVLYERKVPERRLVTEGERDPTRIASLFFDTKYETVWVPEVVLEFVDSKGATLWSFPKVSALGDLLTAVQYQVAGVSDFLSGLFDETNAAA